MNKISSLLAAAGIVASAALPTLALADHRHHHIHDSGDGWRDLAILGGVAGLAGVATHNSTLTVIGAAGAVYGGVRYEQDQSHDHGWGWRDHDHHGYGDPHRDRRRW